MRVPKRDKIQGRGVVKIQFCVFIFLKFVDFKHSTQILIFTTSSLSIHYLMRTRTCPNIVKHFPLWKDESA